MKKQLIVVVHGVGIRTAGESADLLAGALDSGAAAGGWRRRASDDFRIFENLPEAPRIIPSFPARLSRFRRFAARFPEPDSPERVIADFYWGDIAGLSGSAPSTLVGLGRVMLGLVHILRENAWTVFPAPDGRDARLRMIARGAGLAIHGPIFAANIALFFGLVGVALFGVGAVLPTLLAMLLCLGTGLTMQLKARTFLLRHLGAWLSVFGLVFAVFLAAETLGLPLFGWIDGPARLGICSWMDAGERAGCEQLYRLTPFLFGLRLQAFMVGLWAYVALVSLGFGLRWVGASLTGSATADRDLLMPTLSLMSLLWFLLIGLFWAAVSLGYGYVDPGLPGAAVLAGLWAFVSLALLGYGLSRFVSAWNGGPAWSWRGLLVALGIGLFWALGPLVHVYAVPGGLGIVPLPADLGADKIFATSQRGIWASLGTLAVLVPVVAGRLVWRRIAIGGIVPGDYMLAPDAHAERLRLIATAYAKGPMLAMPVLLLALMVASAATDPGLCAGPGAAHWLCWLEGKTVVVVSAAVAVLGLVGAALLPFLSQGLNVAGDVIIYLNDFWWRKAPGGDESLTFAEKRIGWIRDNRTLLAPGQDGYVFRQRIQARLAQLVGDLIASEEPDRIDIVSHSQGTVIALDVLGTKGAAWGSGRALRLVTMGSPWRHLYHKYFFTPESPDRFAVPPLLPPDVLAWTNIFRVDDFVGTHIRVTTDGTEHAVERGGHTNYWTDAQVRVVLQTLLG